jgi:hypothetical protein
VWIFSAGRIYPTGGRRLFGYLCRRVFFGSVWRSTPVGDLPHRRLLTLGVLAWEDFVRPCSFCPRSFATGWRIGLVGVFTAELFAPVDKNPHGGRFLAWAFTGGIPDLRMVVTVGRNN